MLLTYVVLNQVQQRQMWNQQAEELLAITLMDRETLLWPWSGFMLENKNSTLKAQQPGSQLVRAAQELLGLGNV